jgi:hypothetical protein
MSARSNTLDRTIARIQLWCRLYTRKLPMDVAAQRRAEIDSDLHDQVDFQLARGVKNQVVARAIRGRAIRGAFSDLTWRRAHLRAMRKRQETAVSAGWYPRSLLAISYALGSGLLASGIYVWWRWSREFVKTGRELGYVDFLLLAAMGVCLCGLIMLRRERTRWLGALWIAASVYVLIDRGFTLLALVSTTARFVVDLVRGWAALELAASIGITLYFVAVAIWWMPGKSVTRIERGTGG